MKTISVETEYRIESKEVFSQWRAWSPCFYYDLEEIKEEITRIKKLWLELDFRIIEIVKIERIVE